MILAPPHWMAPCLEHSLKTTGLNQSPKYNWGNWVLEREKDSAKVNFLKVFRALLLSFTHVTLFVLCHRNITLWGNSLQFPQPHTKSKNWRWDSNPGLLTPALHLLTTPQLHPRPLMRKQNCASLKQNFTKTQNCSVSSEAPRLLSIY